MSNPKANNRQNTVSGLIISAVLLILVSLLFLNRQVIADQISVWQYSPDDEVAELASRTTMSDSGLFYFYASEPLLESTAKFNEECGDKEPGSAILGCYSGGKIYIYNVDDERLDGISEVTAAHEMLHAAYDRLNIRERKKVDSLIELSYEQIKDDGLDGRLAMYERVQPGSRLNELHSILGTEYANLPADLELYYERYFEDRQTVVSLHKSYSDVFTQLENRAKDIEAQLVDLGKQIESESDLYNSSVRALSRDIENFNKLASDIRPGEYDELVRMRDELVSRTEQVELKRGAISAMIEQYNLLVSELNRVSNEANSLNESIDSSLAPTPRL